MCVTEEADFWKNSGFKTAMMDTIEQNIVLHKLSCCLALQIYVSTLETNTKLYKD